MVVALGGGALLAGEVDGAGWEGEGTNSSCNTARDASVGGLVSLGDLTSDFLISFSSLVLPDHKVRTYISHHYDLLRFIITCLLLHTVTLIP